MASYWTRQRLLQTVIMGAVIALITSFLFVYPSILQKAGLYNSQSIYKNTKIDFIAPEPSFEQVNDLPGTNGILKVFPYYLTKTQVNVNKASRTTTVLLSNCMDDANITMYNQERLIEQSKTEYDNPVLVDWQFCNETSSKLGDVVSFSIGGVDTEYKIYAIYETNSIYDGGAILVGITDAQRDAITQQSNSNGYSGMYVCANDYNTCKTFLTTEYRPLGRLKDRDQFGNDEQYQRAIRPSGGAVPQAVPDEDAGLRPVVAHLAPQFAHRPDFYQSQAHSHARNQRAEPGGRGYLGRVCGYHQLWHHRADSARLWLQRRGRHDA